jgi:hypothetical protein
MIQHIKKIVLSGNGSSFAKVPSGDLDVAIIGQLPPTQLPLNDHLEPGALEMECLHAPLGSRALIEQPLERPSDAAYAFLTEIADETSKPN